MNPYLHRCSYCWCVVGLIDGKVQLHVMGLKGHELCPGSKQPPLNEEKDNEKR